MLALFTMLANYSRWANRRLHDAVDALSEEAFRTDCGAFFGSLHGTLNHLVVGDLIWLQRLTGSGEAPTALDAIVADDRSALRAAREAADARLLAYVCSLRAEDLAGTVSYTTLSRPAAVAQPLAPALMHVFNHQTHHRGQAHALLTRLAGAAPSFDLLIYQRETGDGLR